MPDNRRGLLRKALLGASGAFSFIGAAEAQDKYLQDKYLQDKYLAQAGDGGFARAAHPLPPGDALAAHDPRAIAEFPDFRYALDASKPKVASGGWVKDVSLHQLPIARGIAGVHALINPGGSRELHWHATAAEWAIVLEGRCQTLVIDPSGASEINNFEPGDLWYFAKGHGHSIQTIGDKPCNIVLAFDDGGFSPDVSAFSITDWINLTPRDLLARQFGLTPSDFDAFPPGETFMSQGAILQPEDAMEAPWPKESTHKFRLLKEKSANRDFEGGTFRLATAAEFPTSKTMSGALMTLERGALHGLHWHPNANEWLYVARGHAQIALFGSGGRGKAATFDPGDVAYIPAGFGHAIRNIGDGPLEMVQTWDSGSFQEITLKSMAAASPDYLLTNHFADAPKDVISRLKGA